MRLPESGTAESRASLHVDGDQPTTIRHEGTLVVKDLAVAGDSAAHESVIRSSRTAYNTASLRECRPSLSRMLRMWFFTVFSEMKSSVPI